MFKTNDLKLTSAWGALAVALLVGITTGCSQPQSANATVKKIPAGAENAGFLKDYSKLKPVAGMDEAAAGYASADAQKNLHKYIAVVIDPVEVFLASDADGAKLTETARSAATEYFRAALVTAVSDAYPVVEEKGPLVLRLRAAVVGVDFGGEIPAAEKASDDAKGLTYSLNIGKVRVEMELVDSETGEQIAALVDKATLGEGAEIGSVNFTRQEKWAAAREAFDGWAARVRAFLNAENELSQEDLDKADKAYQAYGAGN
jgi:hypothetical protein